MSRTAFSFYFSKKAGIKSRVVDSGRGDITYREVGGGKIACVYFMFPTKRALSWQQVSRGGHMGFAIHDPERRDGIIGIISARKTSESSSNFFNHM